MGHRNFRYYFLGQVVSILGTWIQQVAMSWLVYRLTGSVALLGVTTFAALVPMLVVGPLAGAWIDRHDKRRLLILVQGLLALQALALGVLTMLDLVGPSLLVLMSVMLGVLNAFDTPLRQSQINSFVGSREDLPNALALNAMAFNSGRFLGPPLAGLLLGLTSEAFCFVLNAVSFAALAFGVWRIRVEASPRASGSTASVFREGLGYVWDAYAIRTLILILAVANLTASSYAVLLPVFAKDVFSGDARMLGMLWGAAGAGAFVGTVFLATRKNLPGLVTVVVSGAAIGALALLVFSYSRFLPVSLLAMAMVGLGISIGNVATNMLLQTLAPDHLRGRVVSFFSSTRFGFDAIGGLLAGLLAARVGAQRAMLIEGLVLAVFAVWALRTRGRLRADVARRI
ncbi:putative integral membrane efflux protein [Thauera linaloolentis 47Lol = DSM 12138]|uniref:Putative integral membrane efflux protein n=1 Tax=Thauera linaloolentis (strain DSM 12138 / JCM 21573 / CCUG 41526 / CIP 105981 / IAM 15112 / NBRC 102519 / 47Lol) TaxID=1123367 RepID=N6ZBA0_THAL4|nr:putative integral membrane efflux protein [Thauera linaloolentis 47Lol = DSM 12138]